MDRLFKNGQYTTLKLGDVLHTSEESCRNIGRVESGSIRLIRVLRSGKEIVIKEFFPGEIFADLIVFSGEKYPGWLIASVSSVVVEVNLVSLMEYLKQDKLLVKFLTDVSSKVTGLSNTIEVLSLKTVKEKIAYMLLYHSAKSVKHINVSMLASKIGSSREAVSRAISSMSRDLIISKKDGYIKILDSIALEDLLG